MQEEKLLGTSGFRQGLDEAKGNLFAAIADAGQIGRLRNHGFVWDPKHKGW